MPESEDLTVVNVPLLIKQYALTGIGEVETGVSLSMISCLVFHNRADEHRF